MKPNDIVYLEDAKYGHHRFWMVEGIFLGALGQESVVELRPLTERPATSYPGTQHHTVFVPEPMLRTLRVFTPDISP